MRRREARANLQCFPQMISAQASNFPDLGAVRRQKGTQQGMRPGFVMAASDRCGVPSGASTTGGDRGHARPTSRARSQR